MIFQFNSSRAIILNKSYWQFLKFKVNLDFNACELSKTKGGHWFISGSFFNWLGLIFDLSLSSYFSLFLSVVNLVTFYIGLEALLFAVESFSFTDVFCRTKLFVLGCLTVDGAIYFTFLSSGILFLGSLIFVFIKFTLLSIFYKINII